MKIEFDEDDCLITHKKLGYSAFAPVSDQMGLYVLTAMGKEKALVATQSESANKLMLWHRRKGHPGRTAMKELYEIYLRDEKPFSKSLINPFHASLASSQRCPASPTHTRRLEELVAQVKSATVILVSCR